jgi:type I restriction enzyme, S subunit
MELKPGYKQTEVGVIPEEWELRPLLNAVRVANGQVDPRTEPYKSMILVAPDHIESATGRLLDQTTASEQQAISGKYLFAEGDIVYSKIRPYLRKAIVADFSGLCSADMYPLKPAKEVSSGFMLAVLLGHRFSKYAESVSVRSGMPKINRAELADYVVALPPYSEQRAIAEALGDVDALLGALTQLIAKKRDLKQAAMQQLLTGHTRLPGFHGEWETKTLFELADRKKQLFDDGDWIEAEFLTESGIRLIQTGNIGEGQFTDKESKKYISSESFKEL